jgi:predicted peptidase
MKRVKQIATVAILVFITGCSSTYQQKITEQQIAEHRITEQQLLRLPYVSQVDQLQRNYFVFLPKGYGDQPGKQWPVMLFLHGNGERGNGLDELDYVLAHGPLYEAWIQKKDLPFVVIVPQLHMFGMDKKADYIANRTPAQIPLRLADGVAARDDFFTTVGPMTAGDEVTDMSGVPPLLPVGWDSVEQDLLGMLDHVSKTYATDPTRVYLTGLSYGGFGTWYLASKHPQRFAAIAPVVGWGHPDLMPAIAQARLPVWAFAGGRDTAVQKRFFYAGINQLEQLSEAEIRFTVHEDMAHDAWRRIYAGDDLYNWLLTYKLR